MECIKKQVRLQCKSKRHMAKKVILTPEDRVGEMCFDGQLFYHLDDNKQTAEVNRAVDLVQEVEIPEEIQIGNTTYLVNSIGYRAFMESCDYGSLFSVVIPDTVTIIKSHAFYGCDRLENLSIGNNVEEMGESAFCWCNSLKSIQIPDSVKKIGSNAFDSHPNVRIDVNLPKHLRNYYSEESPYYGERPKIIDYENKIFVSLNSDFEGDYVVPNGITRISRNAFWGCTNLTSISIPDSVLEIGEFAFQGCSGLTRITIPESVRNIGSYAFQGCENLTSLIVDEKVQIGQFTFTGCKNLKERFHYDGGICYELYFHNDTAIVVDSDKSYTHIVIPSEVIVNSRHFKVIAIGDGAFYDCKELRSIVIPRTIEKISCHNPFGGCDLLSTITVEGSIVDIYDAISKNNVETLIVPHKESPIWAGIYGGYDLEPIDPLMDKMCISPKTGQSTIVIPEGVSYIGQGAYAGYDMKTVVIPNSVMYIDAHAFYQNDYLEQKESNLENVEFSKNIRYIGPYAFYGCKKINKVELPNCITFIGRYAFFSWGEQLDTLKIGNFPYMGDDVFYSIKKIIIDNDACNAGDRNTTFRHRESVYDNDYLSPFRENTLEKVYVKKGHPFYDSRNGYNGIIETASNTLIFGLSKRIPNDIEEIGPKALCLCHLKNFKSLPDSVRTIDERALPDSYIRELNKVKRIGLQAFEWLHTTKLIINENVEEIGDYAFIHSKLKSVYIGRNVRRIGVGAFSECKHLQSIVVDESNPYYDSRNNCNAIIETRSNTLIAGCKTTNIPENVTIIAKHAFCCMGKMPSVITIPDSVKIIEVEAFAGCKNTNTVLIGNGVKEIGEGAFGGASLRHVELGTSIERIGRDAFGGCSINSIDIPSRVKAIGEYAFSHRNLITINIDKRNKVYDSRNNCNAIIETATNKLILACRNTIVPDGIKTIGKNAFFYVNVFSLRLPDSVTRIENAAFAYTDLKSIVIPRLVNYIGRGAFACFNGVLFSMIEDPRQCTIGGDAFYADAEEIHHEDRHEEISLIVPKGTVAVYRCISPWKELRDIQEMDINEMESSQERMIMLHKEQLLKEELEREEEMRIDKPIRRRR